MMVPPSISARLERALWAAQAMVCASSSCAMRRCCGRGRLPPRRAPCRPSPRTARLRSLIDDYRITKRGGLGIRNYTRGGVAGIKIVDDTDVLGVLISQDGILDPHARQ